MKWLSTHYKVFSWLLAFLFSFYFSNSVLAVCPSGYPPTTTAGYYVVAGIQSFKYPTASTACSTAASVDKFWGNGYTGSGSGTGSQACTVTKTSDGSSFKVSVDYNPTACATGYTLQNGQCVNSSCVVECPQAGSAGTGATQFTFNGPIDAIPQTCNDTNGNGNNCAVECSDSVTTHNSDTGVSSKWCSDFKYTGAACPPNSPMATPSTGIPDTMKATPVNNPPKSSADCPGGSGFAEVNNKTMCLPSGTQMTGPTSTSTSSGGGTVTNTSTTTINNNGTTTTTTNTTYRDAGGNITSTGTTKDSTGINQAGTQGDNKTPNLGSAPTFDPTLPQESTFNIRAQGNPVFSTEIFQTSASCPADITFNVMNRDFAITFSPICAFADVIRGIVLLLSAIVAMRSLVTS